MPTTVATQGLQRLAHARVIEPLMAGRSAFGDPRRAARFSELMTGSRWLNRIPAYFLAYGALRERPPAQSLRPSGRPASPDVPAAPAPGPTGRGNPYSQEET